MPKGLSLPLLKQVQALMHQLFGVDPWPQLAGPIVQHLEPEPLFAEPVYEEGLAPLVHRARAALRLNAAVPAWRLAAEAARQLRDLQSRLTCSG